MEQLSAILTDHTLRTVGLGAATLGATSGALGCFAVLRKQSLLGDGVSHAALPGIALAFLLTGSKVTLILLGGAALAGWVGALLVRGIARSTRIKHDTALGLVMSVFFGFGLVLLTYIQKLPNARQAGLESFLFGQATALLTGDLITMAVLGGTTLTICALLWKEFKILAFDPEYAATLGLPTRALDVVLTTLLVIAIVIGLQTVGVVLMSAMVVAPASAARQWTDRTGVMFVLAGGFGAVSGVTGAFVSSLWERMPTGPTIVICLSAVVVFSLLFAPNRGVLWGGWRARRLARQLRAEAVLIDLFELSGQHGDPQHSHGVGALRAMSLAERGVQRCLRLLTERELVRRSGEGTWAVTERGAAEAQRLLVERKVTL